MNVHQLSAGIHAGHNPGLAAGENNDDRLLTINEVASLLQCSTRSVYSLLKRGEIPRPLKVGGLTRWRIRALRWWMAQGCPVVR
jgi:excisionase family DNA binding protein